jgi:hemolysin activation/secretion protein
VEDLGQVGAAADFHVDTRDQPRAARRGITFGFGGSYYPRALDLTAPFGEGHAEASSYLTARIPLRPTLALRVAGRKVWGTYPFYEAAYIGGDSTVRGFVEHRFAGDAAVYGNVELRLSVARFYFLVPGQLGVFGLGDAGRVYLSGETSDRWHAAAGGGVWLSFLSPANTVSVAAAHSVEGTRLYVKAGFAF